MEIVSSQIDRRKFLKKGLAGVAAVTAGTPILNCSSTSSVSILASDTNENRKVITRKLGKTGIELPVVSMGVMNADNPNLLKAAFDQGIVHFDTAHVYQGGRNEEMCGKVLKNKGRDSFVISTKIPGNEYDEESGEWEIETDATQFVENFEVSLKRLQMDYVDILYLHGKNNKEEVMEEDLLNAMIKLKRQGKTRFIGVSTHRNEPEVINAATDSNVYDVVLTAYNFKQNHHKTVGEAIERASKAGLGIIAMKTQAGVFWDEDEEEHKINMKAALKWTLQNPHVHTTIPGFATFDQMAEDIEIMENLNLSPQEQKDLKLGKELGMVGLFCNQCDVCRSQCVENFNIPQMMRSYMYAFGYKKFAHAKETLLKSKVHDLPCLNCIECMVDCTSGFNVKERLSRIYEIKNIPDSFLS